MEFDIVLVFSIVASGLLLLAINADPTKRINIHDKIEIENIKQFQSENGLLVDGQIGLRTKAVLLGCTEADTTSVVEDTEEADTSETHEIKQEKCPYCSGTLDLVHNKDGICTCEYCGSQIYIW